jgi:hydroxyacylglutathione hydrolase
MHLFAHEVVGPLACNCYIVGDAESREALVIDPGGDADRLWGIITSEQLKVTAIVATHAHFDHIIAAERLRELTSAPFFLHDDDKPLLPWMQESGRMFLGLELPAPPEVDTTPSEGDRLTAGNLTLEVLHTPGHSPGSISLVGAEAIFSGDTLFQGSVGRTDLPGGDTDLLLEAIKSKLFTIAEDLPVYPGHGPPTSLAEERRSNPFVGEGRGPWTP